MLCHRQCLLLGDRPVGDERREEVHEALDGSLIGWVERLWLGIGARLSKSEPAHYQAGYDKQHEADLQSLPDAVHVR